MRMSINSLGTHFHSQALSSATLLAGSVEVIGAETLAEMQEDMII